MSEKTSGFWVSCIFNRVRYKKASVKFEEKINEIYNLIISKSSELSLIDQEFEKQKK